MQKNNTPTTRKGTSYAILSHFKPNCFYEYCNINLLFDQ